VKHVTVAAASAGLVACSVFSPFWPYTKSPAEHAHDLDARCRSASEQVSSGPVDREARLVGSRIHVRPLPGLSPESLERALECHEARVTLGSVPPLAENPYVLPDRWLAIDVASEGDGLVVQVKAENFDDAKQVLDRARRFVGARPAKVQ
jgi:hypothetical protein